MRKIERGWHAELIPDAGLIERLNARHGGHNVPVMLRKLQSESVKLWSAALDPDPVDFDNLRSEHERLKLWLAQNLENLK